MLEVCILTVGHSPESFRGRASPPRRTALPPTRTAPARACSRLSESHLAHQSSEARIGLKTFRFRVFAKPRQQVRAFLVSFLQPLKRLVLVSESSVNVNTGDARDVMFLFYFVQ